jgi:general stress protein 26
MDGEKLDAYVYPTWSNPPRLIGDLNTPHGDNSQFFSPTTGFPAVQVPMGYTRGTLPAGVTFFGRAWSEGMLITLAYAYEQATRHRRPPASTPPLAAVPAPAAGQAREKLLAAAREIIAAAGPVSVITVDESGRPQARAMDAFAPDEHMVVWFATNPKSRKVGQIARDPRVTLYYYDAKTSSFVTLFGRARLVDDPAEKQKRWKPGFEAFWPDRGASYLLVEVTPERMEVVSAGRGIQNDPVTWAPQTVVFEARK